MTIIYLLHSVYWSKPLTILYCCSWFLCNISSSNKKIKMREVYCFSKNILTDLVNQQLQQQNAIFNKIKKAFSSWLCEARRAGPKIDLLSQWQFLWGNYAGRFIIFALMVRNRPQLLLPQECQFECLVCSWEGDQDAWWGSKTVLLESEQAVLEFRLEQ